MRLGIVTIPRQLPPDGVSMIDHLVAFAQQVEKLQFHGLWLTDAFGRGWATLDPLSAMGVLCAATRSIELGTCVIQLPIRHPVEHAHRAQTINLLSNGRFRFGVGTGSTKADFDVVQADYDARFKVLPGMLDAMRRTWNGEPVHGPALSVWPGTEGGPPVMLGAWRSPRWINLAAQLQGWISSGIHSSWDDVAIGLRMYREAGGQRAIVANIFADFREGNPQGSPIGRPLSISLIGQTPAGARDILQRLADMGIDDALIVCPFDDPSQLETIRGLL
jgi:alkanesulfonate monooxygenase SsuD/methylene tetrahydromethanopterin reductase-like flavin-dependent oxidoreductase (luciferase family)